MVDPSSQAFELVKEAWKIVEKGLEYERTAQEFESMENELRPMFKEIEELARKMDLPPREIKSLERIMTQMREARLNYAKIECWNCCLAPCYKDELDKAEQSIENFISRSLTVQMARTVMEIRYHQIGMTTDQTTQTRQPTLTIDVETLIYPEFIEGLNRPLFETLKSRLMRDDGDHILNLTGFTGTGKTTLALQLCLDKLVRGWFNGNVSFEPVGSKIESSGEQLARELCKKWNDRKGLLVVDDVGPGSQDLFDQCLKQLPSNSKILVISRVTLPGLGSPVAMTKLEPEDAVTLLRHFARPIGTASYDLPSRHVLLQVAELCGGFPMAIKMIGRDLRGKPNEFWEQYLREWSQQGHSILNTHTKLLDHLHHSLQDLAEYRAISEFFMDLGLFPKHANIPVSALLDMWVELYSLDEDGIKAMTLVYSLTAMNLADRVVQMRVIGSSSVENHMDNHFLTQHGIMRDLANKYSGEQADEFERKRLIIEINGNDIRPECLRQQPKRGINAYLPFLNTSMQQRVAARILSITTDQNVIPEDLCYIQAAEAQVLVLNLRTHEYRLPEFIKEMKNLKVLMVTNYSLLSTQLKKFKLLSLIKTLKRIRLQNVSVPCIWELKNLRKISLHTCEVMTAFENSYMMKFCQAMPHLAELKIEDGTDLVEIPASLCNIVNLKKLSITKCRNFTKLPQEIRKLRKLELLRINYCANFEEMPESISELQSLTFLDISHCRTLRKLPENIGQLQNLTKLYMSDCLNIDDLPISITSLTRLKRVICDEYTSHKWGVVKAFIEFDLEVKTAIGMP